MTIMLEFSTVPYPGLRPFRYDESDIFFGREAQIDQLLTRLSRNHFLAVTGPSGCGKSSLIKAGMIPALSAGFMAEAGSRWRVCELRPGDRPLGPLAPGIVSGDICGDHHEVGLPRRLRSVPWPARGGERRSISDAETHEGGPGAGHLRPSAGLRWNG